MPTLESRNKPQKTILGGTNDGVTIIEWCHRIKSPGLPGCCRCICTRPSGATILYSSSLLYMSSFRTVSINVQLQILQSFATVVGRKFISLTIYDSQPCSTNAVFSINTISVPYKVIAYVRAQLAITCSLKPGHSVLIITINIYRGPEYDLVTVAALTKGRESKQVVIASGRFRQNKLVTNTLKLRPNCPYARLLVP